MQETNPLPTPVEWAHELLEGRVTSGSWALDATAGNGHDTLKLARLCGPDGRVFAFDIQAAALDATRVLLSANGVLKRCTLLHAGHERLKELLPLEARGRLAAVMFNLGWLPGHDKHCITRAASTCTALASAIEWLQPGGLITVVAYPNHEGGAEEAAAVSALVFQLSGHTYEARHLRSHYRQGLSPECWAIRKRSAE